MTDIYINNFRSKLMTSGHLNENCWNSIKQVVELKTIKKGAYFSKEGSYNREFAFTCDGVARIYFSGTDGKETTKYFVRENEFLIASIEPNVPSSVNIQALTNFTYLFIPYTKFQSLLETYKELPLILNTLIFNYFGKKQQREINLISKNSTENYLAFLKEYKGLEEQIPHYYIASYLGITPTQLSRVRKNIAHQHL